MFQWIENIGVSIESAWPGSAHESETKFLSGTSMAAPLVAGQALLIVAAVPDISVENTRDIIQESASRGTMSGSHIDPRARGSRVARVPWLSSRADYNVSFSHVNTSEFERSRHDNIVVAVETTSQTKPVMQYATDYITRKMFESIKNGLVSKTAFDLQVACNNNEPSSSRRFSKLRKAISFTERTRGFDARQASSESGVVNVHIICNITLEFGLGKRAKALLPKLIADEKLQDLFGRNVKLLSEPILISTREASSEKKFPLWKMVVVSIACVGIGLLVGLVAIWIRSRRKRTHGP